MRGRVRFRVVGWLVVVGCVTSVAAGIWASWTSAEPAAPAWAIRSVALPTNFSTADNATCKPEAPGETTCDSYVVSVKNVGSDPSSGSATVRDTLPHGVVVAQAYDESESCVGVVGGSTVTCSLGETPPGVETRFGIEVTVTAEAAPSVVNFAEVEGGGAARVVTGSPGTEPNTVNGVAPVFGVQSFGVGVFGAGGLQDGLAGDHPSLLSTTVNYTTQLNHSASFRNELSYLSVQEPKTEIVDLPLGFIGDPLAAAECPESVLQKTELLPGRCPAASVVGEILIEEGPQSYHAFIYNVVPEAGYPALFGFEFQRGLVFLRPRVLPTAGGYVLSTAAVDVTRSTNLKLSGATITFFGDPTAHDGAGNKLEFFTNPDGCGSGPLKGRFEMDSWVDPERWVSAESTFFEASAGQSVSGCGSLVFEPSIEVKPEPEQSTVDTPAGYEVTLRVPQTPDTEGTLATPDLRDASVSFPAGVSVSPSAANGLVACQASGPEGIELGSNDLLSDGNKAQEGEEIGADGLVHPAAGHCPLASEIGSVEAFSPVLEAPLKGHLYVAEPSCGGEGQPACTEASAADGELFGVYMEVAGSGVIIKVKGEASVDPQSGQVTTKFTETPQLPFSELKLRLNGGPGAPLANPQSCGTFTATSELTPWSAPTTPNADPSSPFGITGCAGAGGFAPSFLAGSVSTAAAVFSPFTVTFGRRDGEQDLGGVVVGLPVGLLARVAGVVLCGEAAADAGSCPAGSRVGTATAAAGAGSAPFWQSGPVFLTGPYGGGPFGLSVVVPAKAGPYNLGDIVVRAAIHVDPVTSAVSVVSNPLPQMVDGVPLRVQTVNVTVGGEGPGFTFNPTDCAGSRVSGTISSVQGAVVGVSSPFAATGCAALPFKPVFTASTIGRASKADGASLSVRLTLPGALAGSGMVGGGANVASFKLEFPKQLPSRNTTLQKACLAVVFQANPAGCPAASDIGSVLVHTPVLAVPLAGPVYLVSYGGEKFPQLVMILQGEGVTLDVTGTVFVSKAGITSVTLKAVPDAPFSSVEVKTPAGPFSILTANVPEKKEFSLCGQSLSMPTEIVGQNGAVVRQATKVTINGCASKPPSRAQLLAKALAGCRKKPKGARRVGCEAGARKRYGPARKASKSNRGAR